MESSLVAKSSEGQFKVTKGHLRLNGLLLLYGHETWWMESSLDAKNSEGQFKVSRARVTQDQMAYHCCMDMKRVVSRLTCFVPFQGHSLGF